MENRTPYGTGFCIDVHLTTGETVVGRTSAPQDPTFTADDLADSIYQVIGDPGGTVKFPDGAGFGWIVVPARMITYVRVTDERKPPP